MGAWGCFGRPPAGGESGSRPGEPRMAETARAAEALPRIQGSNRRGVAAATLGFFVGFAAVALFGPTSKRLEGIMGLSGTLVGLLVATPQLSGSLLRIPFGAWSDRVGGARPILILLLVSTAGMAGLTALFYLDYPAGMTAALYPLVLGLGVLCGAGVATFSSGIAETSYWSSKSRQGQALGLYGGVGNLAPGIFTLILPFAILAWGLPAAYALWLLLLAAGTVVFAVLAVDPPFFQLVRHGRSRAEALRESARLGQEVFPAESMTESLRHSARRIRTWALVALYFTSFGGFLALTSWLPFYWTKFLGFDVTTAAILTAVTFSLLASVVRVPGGYWADRIGGENALLASFGLFLVGAGVLTVAHGTIVATSGILLLAVGVGIANAAVFKLVPRYVPDAVGGASGWIGGLGAFGGFAVPPILGAFVDVFGHEGYALGFLVYVALGLLGIGISLALRFRPARTGAGRPESLPSPMPAAAK